MVGILLSFWKGLFSWAMLVAGTVPWPLCIFPENKCRSWWGGVVGWGWVGDDDVLCTCTHVTCYATAGVVGWGGLGMMTFFALAHMWHATQHDCFNGCGAATLWKLAWRRHKSFSPNWGWLALGKHRWKKELVSGFGKKDLFVVKHGITGRFAIACASWSQGPGHGVTC